MAKQMFADLYGCEVSVIDDAERIKDTVRKMCAEMGTEIVEECCHKFEPVGVTYMAVISSSHFCVHTWPENGYAAVDIFSCNEDIPERIAEKIAEIFGAKRFETKYFKREIEG